MNALFFEDPSQRLQADLGYDMKAQNVFTEFLQRPVRKRTPEQFWRREGNLHNIRSDFGHELYRATAASPFFKKGNARDVELSNELPYVFLVQTGNAGDLLHGIAVR